MRKKYIALSILGGAVILYLLCRAVFVHKKVNVTEVQKGNLVTVVYTTGNVGADSTATLRDSDGIFERECNKDGQANNGKKSGAFHCGILVRGCRQPRGGGRSLAQRRQGQSGRDPSW